MNGVGVRHRDGYKRMTGFVGERILVNGRAAFRQTVAARPYRLRILNGSNARIYRLAWSDGRPLTVIGSDGGLLERPLVMDTVLLGPAERVELWVDFSGWKSGDEVVLVSKFIDLAAVSALPGGRMMGSRRGMMGGGTMPNGAPHTLARFQVTRDAAGRKPALPDRLAPPEAFDPGKSDDDQQVRRFDLAMNHMRGTINNRTFEMQGVAEEETVNLDTTEIWEFVNRGGMPPLPHPIHVHGLQFRVLGRLGSPFGDVLDADAGEDLAGVGPQRDEERVNAVLQAAGGQLGEHDRHPAVPGGVPDVVLARPVVGGVDHELPALRVVAGDGLEARHLALALQGLVVEAHSAELDPALSPPQVCRVRRFRAGHVATVARGDRVRRAQRNRAAAIEVQGAVGEVRNQFEVMGHQHHGDAPLPHPGQPAPHGQTDRDEASPGEPQPGDHDDVPLAHRRIGEALDRRHRRPQDCWPCFR